MYCSANSFCSLEFLIGRWRIVRVCNRVLLYYTARVVITSTGNEDSQGNSCQLELDDLPAIGWCVLGWILLLRSRMNRNGKRGGSANGLDKDVFARNFSLDKTTSKTEKCFLEKLLASTYWSLKTKLISEHDSRICCWSESCLGVMIRG